MFAYLTSCFQVRPKVDLRGSNMTVYDNADEEVEVEAVQHELRLRKESGQDIPVFDFNVLQNFFNEHFQLNEEIEEKYLEVDGVNVDKSVMGKSSVYDMNNSQLKKLEDFEKNKYMNTHFLAESAQPSSADINLLSEEELLGLIENKMVFQFCLRKKAEQKTLLALMLANSSKINRPPVDISDCFDTSTSSGLICTDQALITAQKNLLSFLIKEIGTSIFRGKSLSEVSLPINVFESETLLSRVGRSFLYANHCLRNMSQLDHLEVFKRVLVFFLSQNVLQVSQRKPLKSGLGETHSAYIVDGDKNSVHYQSELTNYHPPVCHVYLSGPGYRVVGSLSILSKIRFNSILGYWRNNLKFQLLDPQGQVTQEIVVMLPVFEINGTIWGTRTFNFDKCAYFLDEKNSLFGQVNYGSHVHSRQSGNQCHIDGQVYRVRPKFMQQVMSKVKKKEDLGVKEVRKNEWEELVGRVEGDWVEWVSIDGREYWNRLTSEPGLYMGDNCALPSDSMFRQDIYYLRLQQLKMAQLAKDQVEANTKKDKILRNNRHKKGH